MPTPATRREFLAGTGTVGGALLTGSVPAAASNGAGAAVSAQEGAGPDDSSDGDRIDGEELAALLDERIAESLEEHDLPGATAAVVADGEVALTEGYGVADREAETAVDPAETLFRVGSVSKPVVATALARQISRGDLDPEAAVSDPLGFSPGQRDEPITTAQLVTHRAGFGNSNRGLWIPSADGLRPLSAYLREGPTQVRSPGEAGSYSNYGFALAGGVLASVADEPFHEAADSELLGPAGMERSSFRQPVPDSLASDHATGYGPTDTYRAGSFPLSGLRPAGALSTTAADMARFLRAHLTGVVDGERVLDDEAHEVLHRRWDGHHDELPGVAFGFVEEERSGVRLLRHNGATPTFYSELVVVPGHDAGLFLAYNAASAQSVGGEVVEDVLSEVLSGTETESQSPDGSPSRAEELTGRYRSLRHSRDWHDRVTTTLQATTVDVSVADDGALVTEMNGETDRWVEIEPLLFERTDGTQRLAFGEGADGGVEYLYHGADPITAFGRIGTVDRLALHLAVAAATVLGLVSAIAGPPLAALARAIGIGTGGDGDRGDGDSSGRWYERAPTRARVVAGGSAGLLLGFPMLVFVHLAASPYAVLSQPPATFRALFALPLLGALGSAATVGFAVRSWQREYWGRLGRLHYALVAASVAGFCWLLWYWNLLFPPG